MQNKKAKTSQIISEIIANRWSSRSYDPEREVNKNDIISVCEAARWAPSSYNEQPWNFIIWNKFENNLEWERALNCLSEWNQKWAKNAPVLIAAMSINKFRKNGKTNDWADYDTGAAVENLCLQATHLGLNTHQIGGFSVEKFNEYFNIPPINKLLSIVSMGYTTNKRLIDDEFINLKDRERISMKENFFFNKF